jgi:hypothetical protein
MRELTSILINQSLLPAGFENCMPEKLTCLLGQFHESWIS